MYRCGLRDDSDNVFNNDFVALAIIGGWFFIAGDKDEICKAPKLMLYS